MNTNGNTQYNKSSKLRLDDPNWHRLDLSKLNEYGRNSDPEPFQCHDKFLMAFAGEIVASGPREYIAAGKEAKRARLAAELGYYDAELEDLKEKARKAETYKRQFERYEAELKAYESAMEEYEERLANYRLRCAKWQSKVNRLRRMGTPKEGLPERPIKDFRKPKKPVEPIQQRHITPLDVRIKFRTPTYESVMERADIIMKSERAFMVSGRFQILMGPSRLTGRDVLQMCDSEIEAYDPTPDVPEINPNTGDPYPKKQWLRILKLRKEAEDGKAKSRKKTARKANEA